MIINDRSYPHPVLAPFRDDVTPNQFELELKVTSDADAYYLDVKFTYHSPTLAALIQSGKATHCVHLECRRNFFREIHSFSETTKRLTIRSSDVIGRVEVCGFVKAQAKIDDYRIDGSHPDYGSNPFQVTSGDVLAVGHTRMFEAYCDYDPLKRISSILTIRRSEEVEEGPMETDTTGDRIVVTLSKKDYDRYTDLKADPQLAPLLANQVVVPALLEGVYEIKHASEDALDEGMDKRWFRSVRKKLEDLGKDIRTQDVPPIEAVQALLQLPLRRSLEELLRLNPN